MKFRLVLAAVLAGALIGCGGSAATTRPSVPVLPTAAPGTPAAASGAVSQTAQQLCGLLTPNDWATFQLTQATSPTINSDSSSDAYCVYAGTSGATGGLEFDAFTHDNAQDATATFNTITGELPGGQPVDLPGTDAVLMNPNVDGTYGAIVVRDGNLVYTISLPTGAGAQTQLEALAGLVATRATQYK